MLRPSPEVITSIQNQGFNGLELTTHNTVSYSQYHANSKIPDYRRS